MAENTERTNHPWNTLTTLTTFDQGILYIYVYIYPYSIYVQKTFTGHLEDVQSPKDVFWIPSGHLLDMHAMWVIYKSYITD